jgi:phage virion morphogenesis protein
MEVNVELKGLDNIRKSLEKYRVAPDEIEDILSECVANPIYNEAQKAFENQSSPFGDRWKSISPDTKKAKGHSRILIHTGTLKNSLYQKVENMSALVGVNADSNGFQYGLTHQFGSDKLDIPSRAFLPVDKDGNIPLTLEKKIERNILEWFEDLEE